LPFNSASQKEAGTPTPTVSPTETAIPQTTPTESALPASATPEFAPFCDPNTANVTPSSQCQIPLAEDSSAFCTKKNPYNLIFISKGATFESLTDGFRCSDAGIKDDRQMVTCTGPMASHYVVSVCNPACSIPTVQAAITQCPKDFNYNALQGCCTQEIQQLQQNCVVLELQTTTCVVNCREYSNKSVCNKNSNACVWDADNGVCKQRK
jgi:hypothetical protein